MFLGATLPALHAANGSMVLLCPRMCTAQLTQEHRAVMFGWQPFLQVRPPVVARSALRTAQGARAGGSSRVYSSRVPRLPMASSSKTWKPWGERVSLFQAKVSAVVSALDSREDLTPCAHVQGVYA